jgi:signal transduction histidine kinase
LLKEEQGLSAQGRQDLEIVLSEADRMAAMIDRLRATYRSTRKEDFEAIQVNNVVEDVHALVATYLRHKEITFEFHPDPELPTIAGLPGHLRQVVLNLLMNAVEAISSGGRIRVSTQRLAENSEILLSVRDNGRSIAADILPHIFDPFVTNKDNGTGLGLTITYDIIHHHHGRIQAENNPEGGATFNVWLPIQNEKPA